MLSLPQAEREIVDGRRWYRTPEGNLYPSVTTVLGETEDTSGLDRWKDIIGHDRADHQTRAAAHRGSGMHARLEKIVLGQDPGKDRPHVLELSRKIEPLLEKHLDEVFCVEQQSYSNFLKIAGTSDLICKWAGITSIVDYKTAKKPKELSYFTKHFLQATAYSTMFEEHTGIPCPGLVILLAPEVGPAQMVCRLRKMDHVRRLKKRIDKFYEKFPSPSTSTAGSS